MAAATAAAMAAAIAAALGEANVYKCVCVCVTCCLRLFVLIDWQERENNLVAAGILLALAN